MNIEHVADYITSWLESYAQNAQKSAFVVGVSGGIDSAAVGALVARTSVPCILLTMPIKQHQAEVLRATELIENIKAHNDKVRHVNVNLDGVFDSFCQTVSPDNSATALLALANTRSRLRMTTLYYYAQLFDALVVGTGNKIEDFGVGFFTKYGDGGVDISPIADLFKSEVYALARFLMVPQSILNAAPTDGLWDDARNDEEQLGASYAELEWAMKFAEKQENYDTLDEAKTALLAKYRTLNSVAQHKMKPPAVCIIPEELKRG